MSRYHPEPPRKHGDTTHTAILLVNLGTPDAPTASAVRRYLKQFLWDPRVVEIPRAIWWFILNVIILTIRPAKSAAKYAQIWTKDGSPLKVNTAGQATKLQAHVDSRPVSGVKVAYAMRYGSPSIASQLDELKTNGAQRVLVLPLYPQFAASTTASVMDDVADWIKRTRNPTELRFVRNYHDDSAYIGALAASVREHWAANGKPRILVMSFHGLPDRSLHLGDPYFCECQKTGRLLAEALELAADEYRVTFQSRFGRAKWLQPYTQATIEQLARDGAGHENPRIDVVCPGFTSDCLETLEEIAMECKTAYHEAGGKDFHYIPCLNQRDDWIAALAGVADRHLAGWPLQSRADLGAAARARALGATNA
jgi:protoporphyrin/coproporphyrin ferrochelatase